MDELSAESSGQVFSKNLSIAMVATGVRYRRPCAPIPPIFCTLSLSSRTALGDSKQERVLHEAAN